MYNTESILTLEQRISWNKALDSAFVIELDDTNLTGTSGKHFQGFHQLVSIENIYAATTEVGMSEEDFNALLTDIRKQATLQVLSDALDANEMYIANADYSNVLISDASIFDNAIGHKVAINVLEMFISSERSNLSERNSKLSASALKLELKGFKNENGHTVATGLEAFYTKAVQKITKKLFPTPIIIQAINDAW